MGNTSTPPATTLLRALQKSGLIDAPSLQHVAQRLEQGEEPRAVAKWLINNGQLTPWQARQLLKGTYSLKLGNYKLCELLHKSGLRCSFLAEHERLGRKVCLTMLSGEAKSHGQLSDAFLEDARAAASLDHRNLAHVYDVDHDGDRLFVVTERIEGASLAEMVGEGGPLTELEAASLIRQAAAGLEHAHQHQVVHAGLNVDNVLVDSEGVLKIMDIGFPSVAVADAGQAELVDGGTAAGDMYALGNLLHFALAGKLPQGDALSPEVQGELRKVVQVLRQPKKGRPDAGRIVAHLTKWIDKQSTPASTAAPPAPPPASKAAEPGPAIAIDVPDQPAVAPEELQIAVDGAKASAPVDKGAGFSISAEPRRPGGRGRGRGKAKPAGDSQSNGKPKANPKAKAKAQPAAAAEPPQVPSSDRTGAAPAAKAKAPKPSAAGAGGGSSARLGWMIGGGIAALLLLGAVAGGAVWWFSAGDDDRQVAAADGADQDAADGEDAAVADSDASETNPSLESNPSLETNPVASNPVASTDRGASGSTPAAVDTSAQDAAADPATSIASQKPAVDQQSGGSPDDADAGATDDPAANGADVQAVDPQSAANPSGPEAQAGAEPQSKPDPKPESKAEPKAEPEAAPQPNPEPEPAADPFAAFPAAVDLPQFGAAKPLGKIQLTEKQLCFIKIRGGTDTLPRSKAEFDIRSGTDTRAWMIQMNSGDSSQLVAKLTHEDDTLSFAWTPEAEEAAEVVAGLKNCLLSLSVAGSESQLCALRTPIQAEPFAMKLEGKSEQRWSAPELPAARRVSLKITKIDGVPNFTLDPEGPMVVDKGAATLKIGAGDGAQLIHVKLTTNARGGRLDIEAAPMLVIEGIPPQRLNPKGFSKALKQAGQALRQAELLLAQMTNAKKQARGKRNPQLDQQLSLQQQGVEKIKQVMQQLKALEPMATSEDGVPLHFRLTASAGLSEFDILHAGQAPPKPAKKKP